MTTGSLPETLAAPDYAEALTAWRVWEVIRDGMELRLRSVVRRTPWPVGEPLVAECLRGGRLFRRLGRHRKGRPVPDTRCECGIYAGTLRLVRQYLEPAFSEPPQPAVLGLVSVWGTVIECERGYRAECAYPQHLYVPDDLELDGQVTRDELVAGLEAYGVEVERLPVPRISAVDFLELKELAARS